MSVVTEDIEDMIDPNETADASIQTEHEEELLVFPAHTVPKEETVMVEDVNALPEY